ncbi:hypothetical protein [Xanthocytophaga flava]|uniref:hypothetical protein n=1 Tax=Xanthocytophaga flava TaxID=3048013 RepID=UPI0028D37FBD|nr:hypothetical protein [Xanthocytophaga flavus]MDJ1472540.1 hypothetical protein [Xanthocytophaga flavus]
MNYILRGKIEAVDTFKVNKNLLSYKLKSNDRELYFDNNRLIDKDNWGYFYFDNFLCLNHEEFTDLIEIETQKKITIPAIFNGTSYWNNTFLTSKDRIREGVGAYSSRYVLNQLNPFKILYELPHRYKGSGYRFRNQYLQIHNKGQLLRSLSLINGEYEWEVDLSDYCSYIFAEKGEVMGSIRQVLGIWNDILWLYLESRRLLGILLSNGQIVANVEIEQTHPELTNAGFTNGYLDEKQGLVCFLATRYYLEFDLAKLQIHRIKNFTTGHADTDWNFGMTHTFTEEYVYFTANQGRSSGFTQLVGVLNRASLQVEWYQNLGTDQQSRFWSLNQAPQVSENKLYVLDSEGTLHIFERE